MYLHRNSLFAALCTLSALGTPTFPRAQNPPLATLTVHVNRPGAQISPSLYGVFFEEINHAGDGGLYAEMVRNRTFEEGNSPTGWTLLEEGGAKGNMVLDTDRPLNEASHRALRVDRTDASGKFGVVNSGYWGMSVKKGGTYQLSFFARRSLDFTGPLTVTLEDGGGQVYARKDFSGLGEDWKRFSAKLTVNDTSTAARIVISPASKGTVWLDVVSLFPTDTYMRRTNGLRADLASKVNSLKPAFVRFPGGCFVEGNRITNAFRWKETLGDISQRPGHLNDNWGYRSSDGLGYHEYLQMCEDVGAEALFVVNCGMSHRDFIPVDQLQPWIQDCLDAIEYANGPAASKWGAVRARNGHPAPFHLKYIEIGNENGLLGGSFGGTRQQYAERYLPFYNAIKAKYPDIKTIADIPVPHPMETIDEHYYNAPGWFLANTEHYDNYNRKGPKIYVGEYAVTQDCGTGNLRAALAEAAFMTGLERNADIVTMSSYAPLFVNVNDRKWNPDAICFNGSESYGTPSYYVQKLFSQNRADTVLPLELTGHTTLPATKGGIGLGTWRTQAEYKDIEVTHNGQTLYSSNFAQGASDWKPVRGDWKLVEGAYRQTNMGENQRAVLVNPALENLSDYTLHLKARKLGGAEGFLILFRAQNEDNYYWWNIAGWVNREHGIEKSVGAAKIQLGNHAFGGVETGRWYDIRIEVQGSRIRCYLDGKLIHDVQDKGIRTLAAVAGNTNKGNEIVLKVVNASGDARPTRINLEGAGRLHSKGKVTVMSSKRDVDENSLAEPTKIAPITSTISGVGPIFDYTFAPYSVTILRLQRQP
jgi:alpha-L-arabinofuranosidase